MIFGVEGDSLALARQLESHDWRVVLVDSDPQKLANLGAESPRVELLADFSADALRKLNMPAVDGVVLLLSDAENYIICEQIYETFGIDNVIVRLQDHVNFEKFHELGALVVEPHTAMVSLLDQFVRSPHAASLLLGMDPDEEFLEIELLNRELAGKAIRDIHVPHDVLFLSISRRGEQILTHGYTRLKLGDHITVVGSPDSLAEVTVRFEA